MNVGALVFILFLLAISVPFSILYVLRIRHDKERIRDYLLDKGCRDIVIQYEWFDFDKSNTTYHVTCRNPAGDQVRTTCKIHIYWGEDIYWKTPL